MIGETDLETYEGAWYHGKRHGQGYAVWRSESGEWENGSRPSGEGGVLTAYTGAWENDQPHGSGALEDLLSGGVKQGTWINGHRQGQELEEETQAQVPAETQA